MHVHLPQGFCCPASAICKRTNEYFWMCVPETRSLSLAQRITHAATTEVIQPALDSLQLIGPVSAHAGAPLELAAILTRAGQPVPDTAVLFSVSPATSTTYSSSMMSGMTGPDGIARVTMAADTTEPESGTSLVSAVVVDGRAAGVKGTIPIAAPYMKIQWSS